MLKVKICGLTNVEDAKAAVAAGAWSLGFNFYPKSPRYVTPALAASIIKQLPQKVLTIGIFVNETVETMLAIQRETGIQVLQLHGDETPEIGTQLPLPLIKAVKLCAESDLEQIEAWYGRCTFLVDSGSKTMPGGTGQLADWSLAQKLAQRVPIILAGGLKAENLQAAIATVKPMAIDVCSGVEEAPGKKSAAKLEAFFNALKSTKEVNSDE